jgi:hypothetical protein
MCAEVGRAGPRAVSLVPGNNLGLNASFQRGCSEPPVSTVVAARSIVRSIASSQTPPIAP